MPSSAHSWLYNTQIQICSVQGVGYLQRKKYIAGVQDAGHLQHKKQNTMSAHIYTSVKILLGSIKSELEFLSAQKHCSTKTIWIICAYYILIYIL